MKRKLFVSCVLGLLICLAAGGYFYVTSPQGTEAGQAAKAARAAQAEKEGQVTSKDRWRLIEMLATEYLEGK